MMTPEQFDAVKEAARNLSTPDQHDLVEAFVDPETGIVSGRVEVVRGGDAPRVVIEGEIDLAALQSWLGDTYAAHPAIFEQASAMLAGKGQA